MIFNPVNLEAATVEISSDFDDSETSYLDKVIGKLYSNFWDTELVLVD